MKKKLAILLMTILTAGLVIAVSCTKEVNSPENEITSLKGNLLLKSASLLPDCSSECIIPGSEVYYRRTESNTVSRGGKSGTANSKTVYIEYYNTKTEFVLKVKSSNGWSDLIIDGIPKWTGGPVEADQWGIYRIPLAEGWKACDPVNFNFQVAGNGPQASFTVRYNLIGICSHCKEQFSYEINFDGTYTFSYTPSEDYTNAKVEFTFAQSDQVIVSGLPGWTTEGQTKMKIMDLVKCQTYEWIVGLSPKCEGHTGSNNLWTDFRINDMSKKNISEPTPNITSDCP